MGHGELRIIEATFESYSFCPADPVNLGRLPWNVRPAPLPPSKLLEISSSVTRIAAPTSGPNSNPAPPSAAMIRIFTEIRMPSPESGSTNPNIIA
jgi:hypothetical protein